MRGLLVVLLSGCAPTVRQEAVVSLSAPVAVMREQVTVKSTYGVLTMPDLMFGALMDIGANMRVAENWNTFNRLDYTQNSITWEAMSKDGTGVVRTQVRITYIVAGGSTRVEFSTTGLSEESAKAFHDLLIAEVKRRL